MFGSNVFAWSPPYPHARQHSGPNEAETAHEALSCLTNEFHGQSLPPRAVRVCGGAGQARNACVCERPAPVNHPLQATLAGWLLCGPTHALNNNSVPAHAEQTLSQRHDERRRLFGARPVVDRVLRAAGGIGEPRQSRCGARQGCCGTDALTARCPLVRTWPRVLGGPLGRLVTTPRCYEALAESPTSKPAQAVSTGPVGAAGCGRPDTIVGSPRRSGRRPRTSPAPRA